MDRITISSDCVIRLGNPEDGPVLRCEPAARPVHAPTEISTPGAGSLAIDGEPGTAVPDDAAVQDQPRRDVRRGEGAPPSRVRQARSSRVPRARTFRVPRARTFRISTFPAGVSPAPAATVPRVPKAARVAATAPLAMAARVAAAAPLAMAARVAAAAPLVMAARVAAAARLAMAPMGAAARGGGGRVQPQEDYRLSVDRRPTAVLPLPARRLRIGRTSDNDLVLSDLSISRRHAELRKTSDGKYKIVDLGSHNGTFVNGQRVTSATLTEKDIVSIGHATFRLTDGELREYLDIGDVSLVAQDLVVQVSGGKILLDHVSFPLAERCLVGIIGPSGAGKSTLLGALTGMRPADRGVVLYDNRDLYKDYAELRTRIGLVPQDSIMHTQLTTQRALRYAAELRFPPDTHARERHARVDEVMSELALTRHAETRADKLSGGQLKRVNVAPWNC